ncbi:TauD/TfdA family dioxygenase [Actinoplanes siamensis]|uniref:TauD/TfdA-like domain-containing protein n=1 Tax=Actinoplanes siamensis TaxID=1223317 RepID=A0A919NBW0_9ACTN|nr:TauD/TfdA family dioxygenase [Actinoplanes siamensis]GIF08246.1 hypothetical protein Asi03nite_57840 [Actinoplanes siamensis]
MSSLNTLAIDPTLRPVLLERVIAEDHPPHQWPVEPITAVGPELASSARAIAKSLVEDPGYVVVEVPGADLSDEQLISAAWNLFTVLFTPMEQYSGGELVSSIRVTAAARPGVSQYATSHATGGYHTDGTELAEPPQVTGLMCVSSADSGGETLLMDGRRVVAELAAADRAALSAPLWFHSGVEGAAERRQPVIDGSELRYLRRYIVEGHRRRGEEPPTAALDAWDRTTERADLQLPVLLRRGQLLLWDNRRFVHGRKPFTEGESRRWLVRMYGMFRKPAGF